MKNKKKIIYIAVILIILDQMIKQLVHTNLYNSSKTIIKNCINLTYVQNTGGAYGLGNENIIFFIISNLIIIAIIIFLLYFSKYKLTSKEICGLTFILAGGVGNLIDRIFRGYVIDYIDVNPLFKYPIFNFADICIVGGVILIIIDNCIKIGEKHDDKICN